MRKNIYALVFLLFLANGCMSMATMIVTPLAPMPDPSNAPKTADAEDYANTVGGEVLAGFAKRNITPWGMTYLAGYHLSRISINTHADLAAKCLALDDGRGGQLVIVSTDLIGLLPGDAANMLSRVRAVPAEKILITSTHTHSGPDTFGVWGFGLWTTPSSSGRDENYMHFLTDQIVSCVEDAAAHKQKAKIVFAQKRIENKEIAAAPAGAGYDPTLVALQVRGENGLKVTLLNYAVHPDIGIFNRLSPDLVYFYDKYIERATGGEAMFVNGALGAVQPVILYNPFWRWYEARRIGEELARETIITLRNGKTFTDNTISVRKSFAAVPLRNPNFKKAIKVGLLPDIRDKSGNVLVEINYATIGGAGIATAPGEVFPNLGLKIKNAMPEEIKMFFGLTNGEFGYILSSEDFNSGRFPYHAGVSVGPEIGDIIYDGFLDLLKK